MSTRFSHRPVQNGFNAAPSLTKGLFARAEIKPDRPIDNGPQIWDELINIHHNCLVGLMNYSQGLTLLKDRRELFEAMEPNDRVAYIRTMTQFTNDLKAYDDDLAKIRALHAGKTGGENDPNVVKEWVQITEQYENFRLQAEAVLNQSYLQIVELIQNAEAKLAAQNAPADVDVITDVVSVAVEEVSS